MMTPKPLTFLKKHQLAKEYGFSAKTLMRYLQRDGRLMHNLRLFLYEDYDHYFTVRQLLIIFRHFGFPPQYQYIEQQKVRYAPLSGLTKTQLHQLYGIDHKTLWAYIDRIPRMTNYLERVDFDKAVKFNLRQMSQIYQYLGRPLFPSDSELESLPLTETDADDVLRLGEYPFMRKLREIEAKMRILEMVERI